MLYLPAACSARTTGERPVGMPPPATLESSNRSVSQMFAEPGFGYGADTGGRPARPARGGSRSQYHWSRPRGGLRGPHKRMESHIVTLTEGSEEFPLFQHPGTELLYMLEGVMVYGHATGRDIPEALDRYAEHVEQGYQAIRIQCGVPNMRSV